VSGETVRVRIGRRRVARNRPPFAFPALPVIRHSDDAACGAALLARRISGRGYDALPRSWAYRPPWRFARLLAGVGFPQPEWPRTQDA